MAAYSISFSHLLKRPWDKRRAVEGTLAPAANQAIEIRISDTITGADAWSPEEVRTAIQALVERMMEQRQPRN